MPTYGRWPTASAFRCINSGLSRQTSVADLVDARFLRGRRPLRVVGDPHWPSVRLARGSARELSRHDAWSRSDPVRRARGSSRREDHPLEPGEIVTSATFPLARRAAYVKFLNPAARYAMVGVFAAVLRDGSPRVAVTGARVNG